MVFTIITLIYKEYTKLKNELEAFKVKKSKEKIDGIVDQIKSLEEKVDRNKILILKNARETDKIVVKLESVNTESLSKKIDDANSEVNQTLKIVVKRLLDAENITKDSERIYIKENLFILKDKKERKKP